MNAYELADEIDGFYSNKNQPYLLARLQNMLRQQADRIRNLEKTIGFKNSGYETINLTPPSAWMDESGDLEKFNHQNKDWTPLYKAPIYTTPQTKPLSDEEIDDIWAGISTGDDVIDMHQFARAIEERHGIK